MEFKITANWGNGNRTAQWGTLAETQAELKRIADMLGDVFPGEAIEVERVS